jgi:hypothetical protein
MSNERTIPPLPLPRRLLRGVTRTVRVTVVDKNNNPVDLTVARNVVVTVALDGAGRSEAYVPGISIQGDDNNVVGFAWYADVQRRCGRYTIDVNADFGNRNQSRVDFHREFGVELVEHSCDVSEEPAEAMEVDDDLDLEGTLEVTTDGMSAFDQWRTSPESEGYPPTEEGFFAWMRQPSTDAAADVEAGEAARNAAEEQRVAAEQSREAQAASDHSRAASDHTTAASDHSLAASDHVTAVLDHTQAVSDHDRAGDDHDTAVADHQQAEADHTRAEADHTAAGEDHTRAEADHTAAGEDHTRAEADHTAAGEDHTRAGNDHTTASSDHGIAETDHTRAESDHSTAAGDHTRAGDDHTAASADHTQAGQDHTRASSDHGIAETDHTRAESDHSTAAGDHTRAGDDHTAAAADHTQAGQDHTRAESDHTRAESDHARAEQDHEAMQNAVPTPTAADKDKVLTVTDEQGTLGWEEPPAVTVDQTYDATSQNAQSGVAMAGALAGKQDVIDDLDDIRDGAAAGATAYQKPSMGIPKADLAQAVKDSIGLADTALQPADIAQLETDVAAIKSEIPSAASPQNQLADKNFVNSSVATNTANYISDNGAPFLSLAALQAYSGPLTNNDYAFVMGTDAAGNTTYTRYKYNASTQTWAEEYVLNNSSFTAAQWAAINSGIDGQTLQQMLQDIAAAYVKPSGGIPDTDLATAVREALTAALSAYQKPATGIPESDMASGVIPSVPAISTDIQTDKDSTTKTAAPSAVYNEVHPAFGSSQPAGGMLPNVLYKLGTLTGNVTISFASATDNTIENEYKFTFTAGSTAPTITWPAAITGWAGNCVEDGAPVITGGNYYEVSVMDGIALIAEVEV